MIDILFASQNKNKTRELNEILGENYNVISLSELNITDIIDETGSTLEENALIKARYLYNKYKRPCIADDSGLEVEALNGKPGVYSARYAGDDNNPIANNIKLLDNLKGFSNRNAQFRTVIAYLCPQGEFLFEGIVYGTITKEIKGTNGFGYDPLFQPLGHNKTFAEMNSEEKNKISHRAIAINKFVTFIKQNNE